MTTKERYKWRTQLKLRGKIYILDQWKSSMNKNQNSLDMSSENT